MLFSEPKIPQVVTAPEEGHTMLVRFSALQRAENSSIARSQRQPQTRSGVSVLFSEPKIPQLSAGRYSPLHSHCFSALQRAENSSIARFRRNLQYPRVVSVLFSEPKIPQARQSRRCKPRSGFQCSSASRKFLNPTLAPASIHISDRDDHASSFLSLPGASP